MKILILGIGKTKHKYLEEGISRYKKMLAPDVKIEEQYLKECSGKQDPVTDESSRLLASVPKDNVKVLLDIGGMRVSSEKFSDLIREFRDSSVKGITFMIGGSEGVNEEVRSSADMKISFSDMTMTHQMIRLFLTEQLYRAFSIINNRNYHK